MVKKISPKVPEDDNFMHQYGGGVNQYGTKGANAPDEFQSYMNDGMTTNGADQSTQSNQSPFEMMAKTQNESFGAPTPSDSSSLDRAAPENFGPPGIAQTAQDQSSFGAPGFQAPQSSAQQGAQNNLKGSAQNSQNTQNQQNTPRSDSNSSHVTPAKMQKKHSKKAVEKMEIDNMMQNIIQHMKVKDPDPEAWK